MVLTIELTDLEDTAHRHDQYTDKYTIPKPAPIWCKIIKKLGSLYTITLKFM